MTDESPLAVKLGGLELEHPLILSAGLAKQVCTGESLQHFIDTTEAAMVIGGSFTLEPRDGNPGSTCWPSPDGSFALNRMGLPNRGIADVIENLPHLNKKGKLIGISVAGILGDTPLAEQYLELAGQAMRSGADLVELNLSCPNTENSVISFRPDTVAKICSTMSSVSALQNICVKVSPYTDGSQLKEIAQIISQMDHIKGVSTMNTVPNCLYYENDKPVVDSGLAGLSGSGIFPFALGQVAQWREHLHPSQFIIGGGGVRSAQDVRDIQRAGADAVFMVTAPMHDPKIFGKIISDLL